MLFTLKQSMLEKFPEHTRELIRIEKIKQEKELLAAKRSEGERLVSYIGRWVIAALGIVFLIVWAIHL